jgi:xylulokinase
MRVLALDVGNGSVTAAVLDVETAAPVGTVARVAYPIDHPTPEAAEVPARRVWDAVAAAARQATRSADGAQAVGLSCLTPAPVILDAADRPLLPVWTALDRRARPAARQTWADVGPEFLATTGSRPLPGGVSAVCWRQQVDLDPYMARRVGAYLHLNGWLGLHLTGQRAFDPAGASRSGLFGTLTDQAWSPRWCAYFEVEPGWLPPVVCGDSTLGTLRPAVATELGVPAGLPVKLGTDDTSSAMLAAGMGPGDLLHVIGTTQMLAAFTDRPRPDPRRLIRRFGVGEAFVSLTLNPVGTPALDWLRALCFRDQTEGQFHGSTVPEAMTRPTRVTLDPAHLGGDDLEIEAHRAAFRDLTLSTDRMDLLAAVLEALRRGHRQAVPALGVGSSFRRVFLAGATAEAVRKLIPEYQAEEVLPLEEGSLRGVACLFRPSPSGGAPAPAPGR